VTRKVIRKAHLKGLARSVSGPAPVSWAEPKSRITPRSSSQSPSAASRSFLYIVCVVESLPLFSLCQLCRVVLHLYLQVISVFCLGTLSVFTLVQKKRPVSCWYRSSASFLGSPCLLPPSNFATAIQNIVRGGLAMSRSLPRTTLMLYSKALVSGLHIRHTIWIDFWRFGSSWDIRRKSKF
jgi:hypothetical protein